MMLLRSKYLVDCKGINKVQGKPFTVSEPTVPSTTSSKRIHDQQQPTNACVVVTS